MGLRSSSKKDDIPQTPAKDRSHTEQHPGMSADKPPGSSGMNNCPSQPDSAFIVDELTQPQLQEKPIESPSDKPIRQLWDVAYENLRAEHAQLVQSFENQIKGNLGAGIIIGPTTKKDWMNAILKRKMDQIKRDHPTLKLGGSEVEVQDVVKPVLSVFNWVNDFVSTAVSANPYAAIAWSGVSLLLPLLLNPLEQRKSLAQGLEYISSLIVRSYMWEDLHMRRYGSDTSQAASSSHAAYRRTLEMLYREVLRFQIVAYRYYNHNPISRLVRSAVKYDDWIELLESIKNLEVEFHGVSNDLQDDTFTSEWEMAKDRHEQIMSIMTDNHLQIMSNMTDNHLQIMSSLDNNQRQTMGGFDNIAKDLSEMKKKDEKTLGAKQRTKLLEWLCEVDTSTQYIAAREKHQNGTCQWLVNESWKFETWKRAPKSFLWLNGKAGSGKSILSSSVIKHLKDQYEKDPQTALAYFFFSFGNAQQQSASVMISSLLRQLWASRQDTSKEMRNFANLKERGERPDMGALEAALSATIHGFREVFIVVDALDECPTIHSERSRLLECLDHIVTAMPDNLHIFCTSRAEKDIESKMGEILSTPSKVSIDLAEQQLGLNADMELYIDSVLSTEKYRSWPKDVKVDAKNALVEKADGMFQYIVCQFEVLQKLRSKKPILEALKNLPMGLDNTYDRLLQGVDLDFQSQVLGSLKWLALSNGGRLRLSELAEIFALCSEPAATFDKDQRLFDPKDVLEYFPSIVATETGSEQKDPRSFMSEYETVTFVRLAHFTVKEYLMSDRIQDGPAKQFYFTEENAHLKIAHDCLSYHLYRSAEDRKDDNDLPLKRYAVENWEWHLELVPRNLWTPEIVWLASSALFTRSESLRISLQEGRIRNGRESVMFSDGRFQNMHQRPYCYTAKLGFLELTKLLLHGVPEGNGFLVQEDLDLALLDAVDGGNAELVQFLLKEGADVNARSEVFTGALGERLGGALQVATYNIHLAIVELLLDHGADINARYEQQSPLEVAAGRDSLAALELLVSRGADVRKAGCPVSAFISTGCRSTGQYQKNFAEHSKALKLLLDNGADINKTCRFRGTALNAAIGVWISHKTRCFFDFLIQHGADVKLNDQQMGQPLQAACWYPKYSSSWERDQIEKDAVVKILLDMGAEVNAQGGLYGNALQKACADENIAAARLLLDRGAEINKQGGRYGTALQAACVQGHPELVDFLLGRGADVGTQGGKYGNALQAATRNHITKDRLHIVKHLLQHGADVNSAGGAFGTALQAAASLEHSNTDDIVSLLLNEGAKVNEQGGFYGTALQGACAAGNVGAVRLLLDHGADVNIEGGEYKTALQAACTVKDCSLVRLLIDHGADVHVEGGVFGGAWHAAAAPSEWEKPSNDTLKLLLDNGVDINDRKGRRHGTALQAALELSRGHSKVVSRVGFLLEHGADVNVGAGLYGFPLQSACMAPEGIKGIGGIMWDENVDGLVYLLENCSDIDVNMKGGIFCTALQAAVYNGKTSAVRMLLDHGADTNIRGGKYGSALNAAVCQGHWDLVEILLNSGAKPDCQQPLEPDQKWLELVAEEDGRGAVERYETFCKKLKVKLNDEDELKDGKIG